ncbi:methylated-DNA--[protein]-cysteine S-methyltransferase [Sporichthya polymorpha]|uniref:methylated-DNA--[protein]-cysteine S-methyltransferase n=1 Tax=Sporichthya polymorpha TaxID=35751 RepID=UPI0003664C44|nr:methylated-DNA--[protein]-cysteine S-methyltransferase [Sporichthya polymorpha]
MTRTHVVVDSPIGPMTVVADGETVVGIYMDDARHLPPAERFGPPDDGSSVVLKEADLQLGEYFAGERTVFDLPLAAEGTPFQRRVWDALCEIPYGETISYGELARRIGQPTASRAVGLANGRNPISVVVPCHRVIGSSGKLVGYGGGLSRKQTLLELEQGRDRLL